MKQGNGFTLIELLIVIMIMGILTVLTVSQFQTAKQKANDVSRKGDLNALSKALLLYYADYGVFPTAVNGQIAVNGSTKSWGGTFDDTSVNPAYVYMKVMPKENVTTNLPYCYKVDSLTNPKKFGLFAKLENLKDSQCLGNNYTCNGVSGYCFAFFSPNAKYDELLSN